MSDDDTAARAPIHTLPFADRYRRLLAGPYYRDAHDNAEITLLVGDLRRHLAELDGPAAEPPPAPPVRPFVEAVMPAPAAHLRTFAEAFEEVGAGIQDLTAITTERFRAELAAADAAMYRRLLYGDQPPPAPPETGS